MALTTRVLAVDLAQVSKAIGAVLAPEPPGRATRRPAAVFGAHLALGKVRASATCSVASADWSVAGKSWSTLPGRWVAAAPTWLPLRSTARTPGKPASVQVALPRLVNLIS